jgi:hypothetical protein
MRLSGNNQNSNLDSLNRTSGATMLMADTTAGTLKAENLSVHNMRAVAARESGTYSH